MNTKRLIASILFVASMLLLAAQVAAQVAATSTDALAIMTEAYARLGQEKLSADARRVLELNYPDHLYLQGKYPPKRHAWKRLVPFTDRG